MLFLKAIYGKVPIYYNIKKWVNSFLLWCFICCISKEAIFHIFLLGLSRNLFPLFLLYTTVQTFHFWSYGGIPWIDILSSIRSHLVPWHWLSLWIDFLSSTTHMELHYSYIYWVDNSAVDRFGF